jgi:Carboxypeptidase regulatory-like domain
MANKTRCLLVAVICLLLNPGVWAQAVGTIVGTVADPNGSMLVGVGVTAVNDATKLAQSTVTNGSGEFTIPNLKVGTYDVSVVANGFSPQSIAGITLDLSQSRSLKFKLVPQGVQETAVVTAVSPLLNTSDGSLAGLVTQDQVQNLPLNGRSIQNLVMLQPGMAPDSGSIGWLAPQWVSNGNRGETSVATLDGSDASDSEMGTVQFWELQPGRDRRVQGAAGQLLRRVRAGRGHHHLFNHPTFAVPSGALGNPSFGISTATQTSSISQERQMQFGVRFIF